MRRLAELDQVLLAHAELPGPIAQAAARGGDPRRYATWLEARPRAAELEAIDLLLLLALETKCRVHIVHLSCAAALDRIERARQAGARVTVETCPHYLTFAAEDIPDGATAFKCAPPLRERDNRERLWNGLRQGGIDLVASDHSPAPPALKHLDTGDFLAAWGGIASLEISLAATWTGTHAHGHGLSAIARWMCQEPARLAGMNRKGRIAPGCDADLLVFEPDTTWTVEAARLHQRHPVTPYAGLALRGKVRRTFVRGVCVYEDGRFPGPPTGSWLRRGGG
jgi:allantoinase